jgi:hypothetical protein
MIASVASNSAIKSSKSSLSKISDVLMSASSKNAFAVFNSSRLLFSNFSILILDGREKYSSTKEDLEALKTEYSDEKYTTGLQEFDKYFENKWKWSNDSISEYVSRVYLKPNKPKFLYYDEYFSLPSRISIEKLENSNLNELKTAKALFELADINTSEILESDDFEDFIAELEATEAIISEELFKYWATDITLMSKICSTILVLLFASVSSFLSI